VFTKAIVRPPGPNFADGLTTVDLGCPVYAKALTQHGHYCRALERCGLTLTRLEVDVHYPDSTFVEDVAILTERCAILTRPAAPSRAGEVDIIRDTLASFYSSLLSIQAPGTLDGGDICEAGDHFFIGISKRTNAEGARQLASLLAHAGYTSTYVDIRGVKGILHLKSGLAYIGARQLVVIDALAGCESFAGYDLLHVSPQEEYAANCVRVNEHVLLAAGFPAVEATIRNRGYNAITLDMSEFQKMDGGLSCLSLRF
jgi:dimethylargininase